VRAGQNVKVGNAALIVLMRRQHVMSKPSQFLDHPIGEIFIGVEVHPASLRRSLIACFVLLDGAVNLFRVRRRVNPCRFQIVRR
jgi:hypothetical protein